MTRKTTRKARNIEIDSTLSLNKKPSQYEVVIFNNEKIDKNTFSQLIEKFFNRKEDASAYSTFQATQYVSYGPYTRDIAETITAQIKLSHNVLACCMIKNN